VVPPLKSIEESVKELKWAKDNGAVGVFFRGIEGGWTLDNPYLFPIYKAANDLDLPICIHTGAGCPAFLTLFDVERNHTFGHSRIQPLMAFRDIVANKIPEQFPRLKFGFIEASCGLGPSHAHFQKAFRERWKFSSDIDMLPRVPHCRLRGGRGRQRYIAQYTGEDHLLIGSDYGHQIRRKSDGWLRHESPRIFPRSRTRLFDNPKQFYPLH
jgi:predicted TIM-barrel fold metal-dependent hydrolase